jgi:hypothetical protein
MVFSVALWNRRASIVPKTDVVYNRLTATNQNLKNCSSMEKERVIIAEGNYAERDFYHHCGVVEFTIGTKEGCYDKCQIAREDGLYKLFKNGKLDSAADRAYIIVKDK